MTQIEQLRDFVLRAAKIRDDILQLKIDNDHVNRVRADDPNWVQVDYPEYASDIATAEANLATMQVQYDREIQRAKSLLAP